MKKNYLLNEGYQKGIKFTGAKNQYIFTSKKKYLDFSMCSGTMFLGHAPNIFTNSLNFSKKRGVSFGLPNETAANYSKCLKKIFPHFSKFVLCSTGAEANIRAIRIARAVTKKDLIVMVSGSWHGSVDSLLFDVKDNKFKSLTDGLANNYKKNLIIIPYNDFKKSKKILGLYKKKIALVIIEPIQQYLPLTSSYDYIKKIYNFCKKNKILISFDEMITGMRSKEFSVQKKINLKPDLSTFGKIVGGGLPIGIVSISKLIESKLKKKKVFLGGTYSGNAFISYIGLRTLEYIIKNKNKIYNKIDNLADFFVNSMNRFFKTNSIKMKMINYHSMLRIIFTDKPVKNREERDKTEKKFLKKISRLQNYAFANGILYPKKGAFFISYSHDQKDIEKLVKVLKDGIKKIFH